LTQPVSPEWKGRHLTTLNTRHLIQISEWQLFKGKRTVILADQLALTVMPDDQELSPTQSVKVGKISIQVKYACFLLYIFIIYDYD
jgi:hypothetical protein